MKVSTVFQDSYFFYGVNLTGGTPFVEQVECLGVEETLGVAPLLVGWGCLCGTDRISWFPDFAAPIFGCWCGHTFHWCNRQH